MFSSHLRSWEMMVPRKRKDSAVSTGESLRVMGVGGAGFLLKSTTMCGQVGQVRHHVLSMGASEAVPHLGLRNRSKLGFAHACACVEPLSWAQNALNNHVGEAHSTSASMKRVGESAAVGLMLGNVARVLHFCGMEDFIAKLKQFSKLDFQSKREIINNGRPIPQPQGML